MTKAVSTYVTLFDRVDKKIFEVPTTSWNSDLNYVPREEIQTDFLGMGNWVISSIEKANCVQLEERALELYKVLYEEA